MGVANSLRAFHSQNGDGMKKTNLFKADLDLLEEEEGFNARDYEDPEVEAHIRRLADAYKAGEELPPLIVKVVDNRILVRDGHCRRRGALIAREEGAEITRLPVLESKGDEVDQTMIILTSNEGLSLDALGRAQVYARLVNMGLSEDEVADRLRRTKMHVQQYLQLHDLPVKLKQFIKQGDVAWSLALELFMKHGTKAAEMVEQQIQKASGEGAPKKKRVTRKALDEASGYRSSLRGDAVKRVTDRIGSMVNMLSDAKEDGEFLVFRLPKEEAEGFRDLHKEILPPVKSPKAAAAES